MKDTQPSSFKYRCVETKLLESNYDLTRRVHNFLILSLKGKKAKLESITNWI